MAAILSRGRWVNIQLDPFLFEGGLPEFSGPVYVEINGLTQNKW